MLTKHYIRFSTIVPQLFFIPTHLSLILAGGAHVDDIELLQFLPRQDRTQMALVC